MQSSWSWLAAIVVMLFVAGCTDDTTHVEMPENPKPVREEPPITGDAGAPLLTPGPENPSENAN